jgi:3-hydroxyisobutyrate dehydrogenase
LRVGFIGLGNMGRRMVVRLLGAGWQVLVHDIDEDAIAALVSLGAERGGSTGRMAAAVDTVLVSLPTPGVVEEVLTVGGAGLSGGRLRTVIDLSTTGPVVSTRVASILRERNVELIDAPVSGGVTGAEAGSLSIMVSGDGAAFDRVRPLLQVLGSRIFYLGAEPGQAQTMKVINNTLCAAAAISAFEGLVLGAKAGLDPAMMLEILNASSGRSFATEVKVPECILHRNFPMRFSTELLHKDVTLCLQEAERLGVEMSVSQTMRRFLALGVEQGLGRQDYAELIKLLEGPAGACFGSPSTQADEIGRAGT